MNYRLAPPLAVLSGLTLLHLLVPGASETGGSVANLYNVVAFGAVAVGAVALLVNRPRPWWPWFALLMALVLWTIGDVVYELLGTKPTASVADLAHIGGYVALAIALVGMIRARSDDHDWDRYIDVAIGAIGASYAMFELVVRPLWDTGGASILGRILSSSYPVADLAIFVLVMHLMMAPGRKALVTLLLAAGVFALVVADTGYAILAQSESYEGNRLLDTLWLIPYLTIAAALCGTSTRSSASPADGRTRVAPAQLAAGGLALLAVPIVSVAARAIGVEPHSPTMLAAAFAMVVLVIGRCVRLMNAIDAASRDLETSEQYFRMLALNASDMVLVLDGENRVIDASRSLPSLPNPPAEEKFTSDPISLIHPDDRLHVEHLLDEARSTPGHAVTGEARMTTQGPSEVWIDVRVTSMGDDAPVRGLIVTARDITERKSMQAEIKHQALHDRLTGLANRMLFQNRLDHALTRLHRHGGDIAVVFCDVDGFKSVNEALGLRAGDDLLQQIATRLRNAVRADDTVARMGGDEFAILLDTVGDLTARTERAVARIRDAVAQPFAIAGTPVVVTCSLGIATAESSTSAEELLRNADIALYRSKMLGPGSHLHYEESMWEEAANRMQLEADLRHAVRRGELVVHYQPLVEIASGSIYGFEALVRWNHPRRGLLMPGDFITLAEQTGLIVDIGRWVLQTACVTAARWTTLNPARPPLDISVNLSAYQLADPNLTQTVLDAIERSGLDPHQLVLELTESVLIEHPDDANRHLTALGDLGIRVAIDDFGTGYSSLAYLQQFAVDIIKIDRTFVTSITGADEIPPLVKSMLDLGRSLEATCIAEGIEDVHQAEALVAAGCTYGQGYLFSRPVDSDRATALAMTRSTADEQAVPLPSRA